MRENGLEWMKGRGGEVDGSKITEKAVSKR